MEVKGRMGLHYYTFRVIKIFLMCCGDAGRIRPLKENSKKVSSKKSESKKAPHATPSRCDMGASSPSFFCHLSISHWRVFEAWVASYLCHMALS